MCIYTHAHTDRDINEESKKSLQWKEMGNQDKAEWGRSKWLKSEEETDVAVRFGLKGSRTCATEQKYAW